MSREPFTREAYRDGCIAVVLGVLVAYVACAIIYSVGYRRGYEDGFRHAGEMTIQH